jgi:hypothetical protein
MPAAANANDNNNDDVPMIPTPPQSPVAPPAANLEPMIEVVDSFVALHQMIKNTISNAPNVLNRLDPYSIMGA